jgi:hypothetical protein
VDPLNPILPTRSDPSPVSALTRVEPTRRDGRGGQDQSGGRRRDPRTGDQDAVELDIDGIEPGTGERPAAGPAQEPRPHIDLTA